MKVCDTYRNDFLNITEEKPTLDIEQYEVFKFQSGWRSYTLKQDALFNIGTRIHRLYNAGKGCYVGISYNNVLVIVSMKNTKNVFSVSLLKKNFFSRNYHILKSALKTYRVFPKNYLLQRVQSKIPCISSMA